MFVRQVKRKCNVRGCKSTDCFAISRTREVGNTVIICKSCLGKALGAIDEIDPKTKSNISVAENTSAPSLFFNAKALGKTGVVTVDENHTVTPPTDGQNETTPPQTADGKKPDNDSDVPPVDDGNKEPGQTDGVTPPVDGVTPDAEDGTGDVTPPGDVTEFKCPICGKGFDSEKGLKTHLRYCKPQTDKE